MPVDVRVGGVQLVNGRVDYTDRLIRPSFSAALSELNGRLGAFDSTSREMATLELNGRIAGTGLLDIRGSLNPMADPLALDIGAKASELELAPLSPYAGKYAGYAIERGKLSMDLHYDVQPDGRLEATNHVVLNQLTFGERIESPSATKLPVRLAVALLSDRHGVIDVNLPVSGSINDPQFSVGGIIWQVIVNLITKIVTAPFSLLAGGGGEDLSAIGFKPGTATMADNANAALDKVAKALTERPALQMTVTGAADPLSEADAMRQAMLEQRVATQRATRRCAPVRPPARRRRCRAKSARGCCAPCTATADLPDKPRNVIGLTKDIPARRDGSAAEEAHARQRRHGAPAGAAARPGGARCAGGQGAAQRADVPGRAQAARVGRRRCGVDTARAAGAGGEVNRRGRRAGGRLGDQK